jgi:FkbM family methyltransferase
MTPPISKVRMEYSNLYSTEHFTEVHHLDWILEEFVGEKRNGSFLEIGAYDGHTNSKTAHLADLGWFGIYVEPAAEFASQCKKRHSKNNVDILQVAIGPWDESGILFKGGLASTVKKSQKDFQKAATDLGKTHLQFTEERISIWSWDTLFRKYIANHVFDLFVIDAEGSEVDILKQIDFEAFKPKVIICEIFRTRWGHVSDEMIEQGFQAQEILKNHDYLPLIVDHHNTVFIADHTLDDLQQMAKRESLFSRIRDLQTSSEEEKINKRNEISKLKGPTIMLEIIRSQLQLHSDEVGKLLKFVSPLFSALDPDFMEIKAHFYALHDKIDRAINLFLCIDQKVGLNDPQMTLMIQWYTQTKQYDQAIQYLQKQNAEKVTDPHFAKKIELLQKAAQQS